MKRVHAHDANNAVAQLPGSLDDDLAAHRVADQHEIVQVERVDDRGYVFAEGLHGPHGAVQARFAVPGQVDVHDPMRLGEVLDLLRPVTAVAAPAVNEHQRGIARPKIVVTNAHAIR